MASSSNPTISVELATAQSQMAQLAQIARQHLSRARAMQRNLRLDRYQGRNGGGRGAASLEAAAEVITRQLHSHKLQSLIWAEHRLAARLSEARDTRQLRPELKARMTRLRREMRTIYDSTVEAHPTCSMKAKLSQHAN